MDETQARQRLLAAVGPNGPRPATAVFPGERSGTGRGAVDGSGSRAGPAVSNLPARNRTFTGRDEALAQLHAELRAGASRRRCCRLEAVHGLGGVGKTEFALEYAHRFGSDYEVVWWIAAEQPHRRGGRAGRAGRRLGVPAAADQADTDRPDCSRCCGAGAAGC